MPTANDVFPHSFAARCTGGRIGIGLDLGTTEGKMSNPTSLTVTEEWSAARYAQRLVMTWKTADERITRAMLTLCFRALHRAGHLACIRGLGIDASNEIVFARQLQREFRVWCSVQLLRGGEKITHRGQDAPTKVLLGNLYVNAFTEGAYQIPRQPAGRAWIIDDHRLVQRRAGSFETAVAPDGRHGDTFDSGKNAHYMLVRSGGAAHAEAASITSTARRRGADPEDSIVTDAGGGDWTVRWNS